METFDFESWDIEKLRNLVKVLNEIIDSKITPVMKDGALENFMPKINGKSFRCECGCNVFHKPDSTKPEQYKCNSCGAEYIGA